MKKQVINFEEFLNEKKKDLKWYVDNMIDAHDEFAEAVEAAAGDEYVNFSFDTTSSPYLDEIYDLLDNDEIKKGLKRKLKKSLKRIENAQDELDGAISKFIPDDYEKEVTYKFDNASPFTEMIPDDIY